MSAFALSRLKLQSVFALNAIGIALWFPRIPDVKAALDVSLLTLSVCFFMLPIGTFIGFTYAPAVLARLGTRRVVALWGAAFILAFILPALAPNAVLLAAALLACGLVIAPVEVGMNAKASNMEKAHGRRVMTRCHAFWSFGSMLGAMLGGFAAEVGLSFLAQQLLLAPPLAAAAWYLGTQLEPEGPRPATPEKRGMALPTRAALGFCLMPIGALLLEGAMMEWSALYLRGEVLLSTVAAAFVFSAFSIGMGTGRLTGDGLAERFGPYTVLNVSAVLAGCGIFLFALADGLPVALFGAVLLGLGCANIYPLTVSLIGDLPGQSAERNIAALTMTAFTAFLIGPPLIGVLGSLLGLGNALLLLTPLGLYPIIQLRRMAFPKLEKA
ncbi:MFS transporter [Algicella marina]|uniref:MFS transporter n=1 Tax=Algicella marina TaxID=2683284 RepID=A0A6P1T3N2_9RHOB|nr:MFS transporter [Algicella marina]QHQ36361.1 MFS transporter [Algicella marina]